MKDLYLMRHGETEFNVQMRVQGWSDSPLTKKGIAQAKVAGKYYKNNNIYFDHAYSSSLKRACDTLELVCDMSYEKQDNLKEWYFGSFEGQEIKKMTRPPFGDFFKQYGGEDESECRARIVEAVSKIMEKQDNNCVLIVSHGGTCMQFKKAWQEYTDIQVDFFHNCSILHYQYDKGIFYLKEVIHHDFSSIDNI